MPLVLRIPGTRKSPIPSGQAWRGPPCPAAPQLSEIAPRGSPAKPYPSLGGCPYEGRRLSLSSEGPARSISTPPDPAVTHHLPAHFPHVGALLWLGLHSSWALNCMGRMFWKILEGWSVHQSPSPPLLSCCQPQGRMERRKKRANRKNGMHAPKTGFSPGTHGAQASGAWPRGLAGSGGASC